MFWRKSLIYILSLFFATPLFAQEKVGLVLSGGGAKGAVHIGIIKALEDNEIPIDYVAGTSIGAIVGSLYAMGYTPEEMLDLFLSEEFFYWQTGKIEENYQFFFRKEMDKPNIIHFNVPLRDSIGFRSLLPRNLINPIQMNQAFIQLFAAETAHAKGDFNNLFVPFLCVASDIYSKKAIVFRDGDLGNAVRASMSFPFVFKPIVLDSIPLFDGGIYDNFPVNPMKEAFHPDFIIGSSVAGTKKKKPMDESIYEQLENMVMQHTDYDVDSKDGVMMKFQLDEVNLLDFNKAKELYDIGYNTTLELIDSIKCRVATRISPDTITQRRISYRNSLPELIFHNIYITGINEEQKEYIENQIERNSNDFFTFSDFKKTYFRLLSNSKIKEIFPHAQWNTNENSFDLYLDIKIKDEITMDFGGNISSHSANQLYIGIGYKSLTNVSFDMDLDMQVGNTYTGAVFSGKLELPTSIPVDISSVFAHNRRKYYENEKLFIDTDVSTFIQKWESYGKLGVGLPFQSKARADILLGYGFLEDRYYQEPAFSYHNIRFDRSRYGLFSFAFLYKKNTLDAKQYPISGQEHHVYAQYISGEEHFRGANRLRTENYQSWIQLNMRINNYHKLARRVSLGYLLEVNLSSKNLWSNFTASILQAPAFTPTPHSKLAFNESFRANQYLAGGISPIWKLSSIIHLRGDFYGFFPVYPIKRGENQIPYYGELFSKQAFLAELSLVAQLPFISISLFANHYNYPGNNWNFGLNIGYLIFGPSFIN